MLLCLLQHSHTHSHTHCEEGGSCSPLNRTHFLCSAPLLPRPSLPPPSFPPFSRSKKSFRRISSPRHPPSPLFCFHCLLHPLPSSPLVPGLNKSALSPLLFSVLAFCFCSRYRSSQRLPCSSPWTHTHTHTVARSLSVTSGGGSVV